MTTPAVNRNNVTTVPYSWYIPVNEGWSPLGTLPVRWDRKVRPESGNSPIVNQWRSCRGWTHWGYRCIKNGGETFRYTNNGVLQIGYNEGAMWTYSPQTSPIELASNNQINECEVKALENLKNQSIHIGVAIAEAKKTIELITKTATRIGNQVTRYASSNKAEWADVKRFETGNCPRSRWNLIPSSWLELQYGWNPLLSDIIGAIAATERKFELGALINAKATVSKPYSYRDRWDARTGLGYSETTTEIDRKVFVSLWYEIAYPALAQLSSLGLINPLEIVWEMVPYSFVVDWFVPVGPWMSSFTAPVGYAFKGGTRSRLSRGKESVTKVVTKTSSDYYMGATPVVQGDYFNFDRTCYVSSPVPGLYLKNPITSVKRGLNALALLAQAFSR